MLWLLTCVPLLATGPFEAQNATASALRWGFALWGLIVGAGASLVERASSSFVRPWNVGLPAPLAGWIWDVGLALCLGPLLVLTLGTAVPDALDGMLRGSRSGTVCARLGAEWSLAGPLAIAALTFCARALRQDLPRLALAGSFAMQFALVTFIVGWQSSRGLTLDGRAIVQFLQWN